MRVSCLKIVSTVNIELKIIYVGLLLRLSDTDLLLQGVSIALLCKPCILATIGIRIIRYVCLSVTRWH